MAAAGYTAALISSTPLSSSELPAAQRPTKTRSPDRASSRISIRDPFADEQVTSGSTHKADEDIDVPTSIPIDEILDAFKSASTSLTRWPRTVGNGHWIPRPALETLRGRIRESEFSTSMVLGVPGSGKSALLSKLAEELGRDGYVVLSIKADTLPTNVDTTSRLSDHLHLPASIQKCINLVRPEKKCVVLIDQLDALSDLVDLKSERLGVLLELISTLDGTPKVHIVASSRLFEFRRDSRLSTVPADSEHLPLPGWSEVNKVLEELDVDSSSWPTRFKESLRVPQHLKIFLDHLRDNSEQSTFNSYQRMLDKVWDRVILEGENGAARSDLVIRVAQQIADSEQLWQPLASWDDERHLIDGLVADGIFAYSPNKHQFGFQHQSVFEHARARMFATGKSRLSEYVKRRQNGLFVRPTLWSALQYLREANPAQYEEEITTLTQAGYRTHIRQLVIEFFTQVNSPSDLEVRLIQPWLNDRRLRPRVLTLIAGNEGWFRRLAQSHLPAFMELPTDELWPVARVISAAWEYEKELCLSLLQQFWLPNSTHDRLSLDTLSELHDWDEQLVKKVTSVIDRSEEHEHYSMKLASVVSASNPDLAPIIIGAILDNRLKKLDSAGDPEPPAVPVDATESDLAFRSMTYRPKKRYEDLLCKRDSFYELPEIAAAAPKAFLEQVWPWFLQVVDRMLEEPHSVIRRYRESRGMSFDLDGDMVLNRPILVAIDSSVKQLGEGSAPEFNEVLGDSFSSEALIAHRLLCRGIAELAKKQPDIGISYLAGDPRRFYLGGYEDGHSDTRNLLRVLGETADDAQIRQLESLIRNWTGYVDNPINNDRDTRLRRLKWDRESRLRLWNSLPTDRLTPGMRAHVESERVALIDYRDYDQEPIRVCAVPSPMSETQIEKASDEHILRLLDVLADPEESKRRRFAGGGGLSQLSQKLGSLAKNDGNRAKSLLLKLDPTLHAEPASHMVQQLGDSELSSEELFGLIQTLEIRGFVSADFRGSAAHSLNQRARCDTGLPEVATNTLQRWLKTWNEFSYFYDDRDEVSNEEDRVQPVLWGLGRGGVLPHGSYWILEALTALYLNRESPDFDSWVSVLEEHLERDESCYTWKMFSRRLCWLANAGQKDRAAKVILKLFQRYPSLRNSSAGGELVVRTRWLFMAPDVEIDGARFTRVRRWWRRTFSTCEYRRLLRAWRSGDWRVGPQLFGELLGVSYLFSEFMDWTEYEVKRAIRRGVQNGRNTQVLTGLSFALANLMKSTVTDNRVPVLFAELSSFGFEEIDTALASTFDRSNTLFVHPNVEKLLQCVKESNSLLRQAANTWLIEELEPLVASYPELVGELCHRFVDVNRDSELAEGFFRSGPHLTNIAFTLQRLGNPYREPGLSLFEKLLELGLTDARDLLHDLDNRPKAGSTSRGMSRRRRR
ncbi:hypothetical protein CGZ80_13695 [Rhodopirellula sp. MGV]|nr:hypothetical protein CGZ80_13695 [Rhodopirellula sp. MGV]